MISFKEINKKSRAYEILYRYVRIVHNHIYFKSYIVQHAELIPKNRPVVAICNHQNGLSDALGILFAFNSDGRRPVFIARADIFKKEAVAKLLRFIKIMPAFRAVDVGKEGLGGNEEIFNTSANILAERGVVALFPEAGHEDCHHLGTFKKGFARIAFKAAEITKFKEPIYIQPISNHYSKYIGMRSKLIITFGEPFEFSELYELYQTQPKRAEKILTDKARSIIEKMMLDIKDKELYEEYETLCTMYNENIMRKRGEKTNYFPNQFRAEQTIVHSLDSLKESNPEKFNKLMKDTLTYRRYLEKLHLRDWIFRQQLSTLGFLLRLILAIIMIPFIVIGYIINFIPYNASTLITRKVNDPMLHQSFHFAMGTLISFPIWYGLLTIISGITFQTWWAVLISIIVLPISLMLYANGKVLWKKLYNRVRRFKFFFNGTTIYRQAVELRKKLIITLDNIIEI